MQLNIFRKKKEIKIGKTTLPLKPMNTEEAVLFLFGLIPLLRVLKRGKEELNRNSDFSFIVTTLLSEIDKQELYDSLAILYHTDKETIRNLEFKSLIQSLPLVIKENDLISLFYLVKQLGALDG